MELQFENEGSGLKATVGDQLTKVLSHSITENGAGEYELSFDIETLSEPSSQNTVVFAEYNFVAGDACNYGATILKGGEAEPVNKPDGEIKLPIGG